LSFAAIHPIGNPRDDDGLMSRKILVGSARASQRYEFRSIVVSKPRSNLLALLDHEPRLLDRSLSLSRFKAK
jgi:hypothetical protein